MAGSSGLTAKLLFACIVAALGSGFQHGYNTGVINAPQSVLESWIQSLVHENSTNDRTPNSNPDSTMSQKVKFIYSTIVSIYCLGGMVGGFLTDTWSKVFGRKWGIIANNIFVFISAGLMGFSKSSSSYVMLIVGRFFVGVNSGLNAGLVPMYLSEIPPINLRGGVGSIYQLFITISILVSQVLGSSNILGTRDHWPVLFVIIAIVAVGQLLLLPICADSPRYLYQRGKVDEAEKALKWLRGSDDIQTELLQLQTETESEKEEGSISLMEILKTAEFRKPLIIACVIMIAQQFSGINAVIFYSTSIFTEAKLDQSMAQAGTIILGLVNVIMTVVSMLIVDRAGRKTLLAFGFATMLVDTCLLCGCLIIARNQSSIAISYACIAFVVLYIIFFASGVGSIPWFLVSELFLQRARPIATSVAVAVNWIANFVVGLSFPTLQDVMGPYVFTIFVSLQLIFLIYILVSVPETKNRSVEDITAEFKSTPTPTE